MRNIIAMVVALLVVGLIPLYLVAPLQVEILLGVLLGLFLLIIVFMALTPLFIKHLVNTPGRTKQEGKSGFHMFTYPEEGKIKWVVLGDKAVRPIMLYGEHSFARVGPEDAARHWQIIETLGSSENPLAGIIWFLRPWAWYVYKTTGAVFTGIYPFQTVREYLIERTKMHREETGTVTGATSSKENNNIILEVREDFSDHLRAREFLYPFRVGAADTSDKVPLNILAVIKARVTNPYKAAFATDRWDIQMVNLATNAVTNFTRTHTIDETLSATATSVAALNAAIEDIGDDEEKYGIEIEGVDLIEISPILSEMDRSKLYAEVLAKSQGKATVIDGQARADAQRALNKAIDEGGDNSVEVMRLESMVRAAEAAKGGTIILTAAGGAGSDPMMAAILAELKKLNANRTP